MEPELWERIPPDSDAVLYMACGDGDALEALRQRNPKMVILAVELDDSLRKQAQGRGFDAMKDAASALAAIEKNGQLLDAWIVAEQAWQDETLTKNCRRRLLAHLRPEATMAWEFYNRLYWQYLLGLVHGDADDRIRHTLADLSMEWQAAGVTNIEVFGLDAAEKDQGFIRFVQLMQPILASIKTPPSRTALFGAERLVLRGRYRGTIKEPIAIHAVLGEKQVCARVRVDEPHAFLSALPRVTCRRFERLQDSLWPERDRLVWVWQRLMFSRETMLGLQKKLIHRHALTIQEWDDDPLHWEKHFQNSDFMEFCSSHAVQTSTPALAEYLRQFNPEVRIFPNCIASLPPYQFRDGPKVTLFFGALNRKDDWLPIMSALNRVLRKFGKRVRLLTVYDREFYDAVEHYEKEFVPLCPYPKYMELLRSCDIALLPLLPTRFNLMKSDLKFLECAAMGTAALTSPTVYAATVQPGQTGLIYDSETQFAASLERLIEDTEYRRLLTWNAWQWVRDHRLLSLHYRKRLDWYEDLFSRYRELTERIGERVPELKEN